MNQSLYLGQCSVCKEHIRAGLSTSRLAIPPPVIKVGCGCTTPPNPTPLIYEGAHTDAKGISGRDVLHGT